MVSFSDCRRGEIRDDIFDLVPATPPRAIIECRAWTRRRATKAAAFPRRLTTTVASTASSPAVAGTEAVRAAATSKIITAALPPSLQVPVLFHRRFVSRFCLLRSTSHPLMNAETGRYSKFLCISCSFSAVSVASSLLYNIGTVNRLRVLFVRLSLSGLCEFHFTVDTICSVTKERGI